MQDITDLEHCGIIDTVCPYGHPCDMCRLHSDYEKALRKSQDLAETAKESWQRMRHW